VQHFYNKANTYLSTLTITDDIGQTATIGVTVTVVP